MSRNEQIFARDFVKELSEDSVAVFANTVFSAASRLLQG